MVDLLEVGRKTDNGFGWADVDVVFDGANSDSPGDQSVEDYGSDFLRHGVPSYNTIIVTGIAIVKTQKIVCEKFLKPCYRGI